MVTAERVEVRVVRMAAMVNWVATVAQTEALEAAVVRAARGVAAHARYCARAAVTGRR